MTNETEIDTTNLSIIGSQGEFVTMLSRRQRWTKAEALNAAAYLVVCAGDYKAEEFAKVFKAITST